MQRLSFPAVTAALCLLGACSPAPEKPLPHEATAGIHNFEFMVPGAWHVSESGLGLTLRTDRSAIAFEDLGPCTPQGFRRTLLAARELYRARRFNESSKLLESLSLRQLVPKAVEFDSFTNAWSRVNSPGQPSFGGRPGEIEPAYEKLLAQVGRLPTPSIEKLATPVIQQLSQDGMQEISNSESRTVDGGPAVVVDLRDRLTHANGRRYLLLVHDDNLFLMKSIFGDTQELEAAFDLVLPTLRFAAGSP